MSVFFGGYNGGDLAETWEWDGTSWTQRTSVGAPAARRHFSMVYDSARQVVVLFGGYNGSYLGDTWEYDGSSWVNRGVAGPSARQSHDMAYDAGSGQVVLFGGSTLGNFDDTWCWDGTAWTQQSPATNPPARSSHGLCYDAGAERVVMFAGATGGQPGLNDTWLWDGSDWVEASPAARPSPRRWAMETLVYDSARGACVVFGGWDGGDALGDTWAFGGGEWRPKLDYVTSPVNGNRYALTPPMTWTSAEALAQVEGGHLATVRSQAENDWLATTFVNGSDLLWIGLNDSATEGVFEWSSGEPVTFTNWQVGEPSNGLGIEDWCHFSAPWNGPQQDSLWNDAPNSLTLNGRKFLGLIEVVGGPSAPVYLDQLAATALPNGVRGHALAPLPGGGALLFGGETSSGPHFPTYELHDADWQKQYSLINPMVRTQHTLLLDPVRQNNLLFGGENPVGTKLNDTWTYAGGQWSYVMPAAAPSPRSGHRMAFDEVSGVGLLFGGEDALGNALADFWSWNGSAWTQLTPPVLPPARHRHGMAFDALRDRVVLYGGIDGATRLDDVWEWNGSVWSQVVPVPGQGGSWTPQPRDGFSMAYDRTSERVVLHGGETDAGCQDDFWSWDGLGWTLHSPTGDASPTARADAQLIYDSQGGGLLLFAGGCGASLDAELWQVDLPVTAGASIYGTGCGSPPLGFVPDAAGRPLLGEVATATIVDAPTLAAGVAMGWSNTFAFPVPLPFDLASIGMPGCELWQSTNVFGLGASPLSATTLQFAYDIPNQPTLMGVYVYIQAYCFAPGANPLQIIISNGIEWRLGGV